MSGLNATSNRLPEYHDSAKTVPLEEHLSDLQITDSVAPLKGTVLGERNISDTRRVLSEIGITDDFSHLYQEVMSDYEAMSSYKEALNPSGAQGGPPPIYPWAVSHVEREIANNPEIDPHSANTRLKKLSRVMVLVENKLSLMGLFERKNHCLENTRKGFGSRCNGGFSFLQSSRHSHTVTANDEQLNQSDFATVFSSQLFNALVKTHFENASDHEQFYYNDDNWKALVKYIREDLSSPMIAEGLEDSFEKKMNLFDQRKG